jgi:hypothetical protein
MSVTAIGLKMGRETRAKLTPNNKINPLAGIT